MFTDWNNNKRIDPVDIGISIAASGAEAADFIQLGAYIFGFVQELVLEKTLLGTVKTFDPKKHYSKKDSKPLNKYGNGPFCRFSIKDPAYDRVCGVYALLDDDGLLYIGQTVNLRQRFNNGYGDIQPVNCYAGGQSTNCKINSMVLQKYQSGNHVYLFFHETMKYDMVEHELIDTLNPPYNSQYAEKYENRGRNKKPFAKKAGRPGSPAKPEKAKPDDGFEEVWHKIIQCAGENFTTFREISFQYKVVGDQLYPLHIVGAVPKSAFKKAYEIGAVHSVAQLRDHDVFLPSYVYAIMTDDRIKGRQNSSGAAAASRRQLHTAGTLRKKPETDFSVGDRVEHPQFGKGTVKAIQPVGGDNLITVYFGDSEQKRLLEKYARLKKQNNPGNEGGAV